MVRTEAEQYESLTADDLKLLETISSHYRNGLDIELVDKLINEGAEEKDIADLDWTPDWKPEHEIARQISEYREISGPQDNLEKALTTIVYGKNVIDGHDSYWRFQACVECILEMNSEQITTAFEYRLKFVQTDYFLAIQQHRNQFFSHLRQLHNTSESRAGAHLVDTIESTFPIFEMGFPNLLALKRILDGKQPGVESLQQLRHSSVVRELSDTDEDNSVYFDQIVNTFPKNLRNALAHGDLVHDSTNEAIYIPSKEEGYTYSELAEMRNKIFATASFLCGMMGALIRYRYITVDIPRVGSGMDNLLAFASEFSEHT